MNCIIKVRITRALLKGEIPGLQWNDIDFQISKENLLIDQISKVLNDDIIEKYEIEITNISTNQETKNISFKITDEALLEKTNGIVQGMSGSPIIQGEYIIGAVTHVVVDNPHKGYGIFITNMLEEGEN